MRVRRIAALGLLLLPPMGLACRTSNSRGPSATAAAAGAPTFASVYATILGTAACAGANCHNPGHRGEVSFSTTAAAYGSVMPFVDPRRSRRSLFYAVMVTGQMPPGDRAKVGPATLELVRAWIDAGAHD